MPSSFTVETDRKWTDADVNTIIARATGTINVMEVVGADAQGLPGVEMAQYQIDTDALEAENAALKAKLQEIDDLLHSLNDKSDALHGKNKKSLPMLHGMLDGTPNESLLDQIAKGP